MHFAQFLLESAIKAVYFVYKISIKVQKLFLYRTFLHQKPYHVVNEEIIFPNHVQLENACQKVW